MYEELTELIVNTGAHGLNGDTLNGDAPPPGSPMSTHATSSCKRIAPGRHVLIWPV